MAVPEFQTMVLPVLWLTSDGQDHKVVGMIEAMADGFDLSQADRGLATLASTSVDDPA